MKSWREREELPFEVWLASTVQEENGLLGAASLVDEMSFDLRDRARRRVDRRHPGAGQTGFSFPIRSRPCRRLPGRPLPLFAPSERQADRRREVAATIPIQRAIFQNYGSDGAELLRRGVETALLTYPTRYTHSPIETVDEADLGHTVDLLVAFVLSGEQPLEPIIMTSATDSGTTTRLTMR